MGKHPKGRKQYARVRLDSGQHRRIMLVMGLLGLMAFVPIGLRLYNLMIRDYDYYARLALRNQTRSTSVTADRGNIYDRNMNILATSVSVENVYLDPHELKQAGEDTETIAVVLGEILEKDPAGRTPFEIAKDAYLWHVSQQQYYFAVSQDPNSVMDCTRFGLYRTLVGYDTGSDLMEHTTRDE